MNKTLVRVLAVILAVIMTISILYSVIASLTASAYSASEAELDELKQQREELKQDQDEVDAQINSLEYDQFSALAKKEVLDEQVALTQEEIDNIAAQIAIFDQFIIDKENEVAAYRQAEATQWELYKTRIRAMEENGGISYFAVLFGANSFADLLSRIDFVAEIMAYDEKVYQGLIDSRTETESAAAALEAAREEQKTVAAELDGYKAQLLEQVKQSSAMIAEIENNITEYREEYDKLVQAEDALQEQIDEMIEEIARQEAAANSGSQVAGTDSFVWPSADSRLITSLFGTRLHPIYGYYTTHYGIDIGASYGTDILAADTGTVVTATYDSSYGYYILLNHGNGKATLYAHLSQIIVEVGDTVTQGETIALSGSTGASTGPHLHFEIRVDGERVNPLNYFSNYTISDDA